MHAFATKITVRPHARTRRQTSRCGVGDIVKKTIPEGRRHLVSTTRRIAIDQRQDAVVHGHVPTILDRAADNELLGTKVVDSSATPEKVIAETELERSCEVGRRVGRQSGDLAGNRINRRGE